MTLYEQLQTAINSYWQIQPYQDIISWAVENIDFSDDISAERTRLDLTLTPHLIQPLQQWQFDNKIRQVQVIGIEQHGKTCCQVIGLLYSLVYKPSAMMVIYPSDELAADMNQSKYQPLIEKIPILQKQLQQPNSKRADRYAFSNSTVYYQGAGKKIASKSAKIRVADQLEIWKNVGFDNYEDLKKRGRSYSQSLLYSVTSPKNVQDKGWQNFLNGSQGYWTLECQNCKQHTMRSCDLHNLQFESTYNDDTKQYEVIKGSCRLICPKCKYQHEQQQKVRMNNNGKYIHCYPQRKDQLPSFQFGVLCSLFPFMSWDRIAAKILQSGKSSDIEVLQQLDNSWRGLPLQRRKITNADIQSLKIHCEDTPPKTQDIQFIFITADTQDRFNPTALWAVDKYDNLHMLEHRDFEYMQLTQDQRQKINAIRKNDNKPPILTLEDYLTKTWNGIQPLCCFIDRQGHRTEQVNNLAKNNKSVIQIAGTQLKFDRFKVSNKQTRLVFIASRTYQADLIYYLYQQKDRQRNYLFFPSDVDDRIIKEIRAVQADKTKKNGHFPQNWQAEHQAVHDYFDVCKYAIFGRQFAIKTFQRNRFRLCQSPMLKRRFSTKEKQKTVDDNTNNKTTKSWINSYK